MSRLPPPDFVSQGKLMHAPRSEWMAQECREPTAAGLLSTTGDSQNAVLLFQHESSSTSPFSDFRTKISGGTRIAYAGADMHGAHSAPIRIVPKEISMVHSSISATVLFMTLALACNNASDEQKKMNSARTEADDKIGTAVKEADLKVKNAQQDEDKKVAEAQAGFMRLREDYRHTTTMNLVELDHHVDDIEAKAKQSSGKARTDLDANLKQIHTNRAAFEMDYKSLESATASTWDDAKTRLDKEWTQLKTLVDKA